MKKIYSLSLVLLLSVSLFSCKDDDKKKDDPTPAPIVDQRTKFVGTYAGTLTCTQGGNTAGNLQIVPGPTESQLDVVGAGIATINGNSFTIPPKTTTSNGYTQTVSYSGTLNGTTLAFSNSASVSFMGTTSSSTCSGNLAKQ